MYETLEKFLANADLSTGCVRMRGGPLGHRQHVASRVINYAL